MAQIYYFCSVITVLLIFRLFKLLCAIHTLQIKLELTMPTTQKLSLMISFALLLVATVCTDEQAVSLDSSSQPVEPIKAINETQVLENATSQVEVKTTLENIVLNVASTIQDTKNKLDESNLQLGEQIVNLASVFFTSIVFYVLIGIVIVGLCYLAYMYWFRWRLHGFRNIKNSASLTHMSVPDVTIMSENQIPA